MYCIELSVAVRRIDDLSWGAHQRASELVTGVFVGDRKRPRTFLIIGYFYPDGDGPNPLCFFVPVNPDKGKLLVCQAPESITPLADGLYWEREELKYDCFEDRDRIWRRLWPSKTEQQSERYRNSCEGQVGPVALTLDGIPYTETIRVLVSYWAQTKETLADAIFQ